MITLKTLPQATVREVFDQVKTHLLTQGVQCRNKYSACVYRHEDLKCAAGCLIGDDEYDIHMEGQEWSELYNRSLVPDEHIKLIKTLQSIHDNYSPEMWEDELNNLEKRLEDYV